MLKSGDKKSDEKVEEVNTLRPAAANHVLCLQLSLPVVVTDFATGVESTRIYRAIRG
jgi:hypothetical protein